MEKQRMNIFLLLNHILNITVYRTNCSIYCETPHTYIFVGIIWSPTVIYSDNLRSDGIRISIRYQWMSVSINYYGSSSINFVLNSAKKWRKRGIDVTYSIRIRISMILGIIYTTGDITNICWAKLIICTIRLHISSNFSSNILWYSGIQRRGYWIQY